MNKMLNKFIAIMGNQEAARNIAPPGLTTSCNYHSAGVAALQS
jgi:hypothetical protein